MQTVKDRAIILRRVPFGEADLMLTLYSEKNGKVRAIAKGARRITSKLLGYTELFTLVSCQLNFKTSIPIVSQMSHEQIFDGVAEDPTLYERLHILAELVDKGCQEQEANMPLYRCLQEGIEQLVVSDHRLVLPSLILQVSRLLGFEPQLQLCAHCGTPLAEDQRLVWSEAHGGIVSCSVGAAAGQVLSIDDIKVMRYLAKTPVSQVEKLRINSDMSARVESLLLRHVQYSLDQDFRTTRILKDLQSYAHVD
ncbi:MAG TPA: DNA repair protein RecO [Patescibacteria group bacterium]